MNEPRDNDRSLTSALRAVAEADEALGASEAVEARLAAEVRSIARARQTRTRVVALAAAAVLFIAIALPVWQPLMPAGTDPVAGAADGDTREVATDFFPLAYSNVPAPNGRLVRLEVPRAALGSFGVASFAAPDDASSTVLADVVVGNDGLARAVRFVRVVGINEQQEQVP
jgi:hypothetical protein